MLTFLNSMDLHEKLMTSESDYKKLQQSFEDSTILVNIHGYLNILSDEIANIGISLQSSTRAKPLYNLEAMSQDLNVHYFELRNKQ